MDNIRIQTTQNVDIEYEVASVGDRLLASLIDYSFFFAYALIALFIIGVIGRHWGPLGLLLFLPLAFYHLLCETFFNGRSFGKMILKIKVVKIDGSRTGFGGYLLRWLFRIVDISLVSGSVALITIVVNGKGQRLGDLAAGTTVIKMKQRVQLSDTILNKVKPEYTVVFPEVSRLSDNDVAIIKEVMRISVQTNNTEAIDKLFMKTKDTMGITTNVPPSQFLYTVLQDYSYYNFDKG
ncbi:MAG: hypothetical protein JWP12_1897 [Bacteroidetes bacterium]|nr:hypothetical protein [Bacteroidota bacterium]